MVAGAACRAGVAGTVVAVQGINALGGKMSTIMACMSYNAFVSCMLVATRLPMVEFFWMLALARLSSDEAICCVWSASSAVLVPNMDSLAVMQLMSCIFRKAIPVEFPICPGVVCNGAVLPFPQCEHHIATCKGVFGVHLDHHGIRDGDPCIEGKHLALFLLSCVDC